VEIVRKDFKIVIKKTPEHVMVQTSVPQTAPQVQAPQHQLISAPPAPSPAVAEAAVEKADNLITIKSPMIGTFYRAPAPDKPSFVNVGDEIKPGQVVCIIEAMKLFNEIESEISGKIVKILVDGSSPVEYDQPLFLVEPA
jgi:acetyl-CoA carboxylase biotin carboxyl carrier protein